MKLKASTPHGVFTRSTERQYTHVVVTSVTCEGKPPKLTASWSATAAGAEKLGRQFLGRYPGVGAVLGVFPVEGR